MSLILPRPPEQYDPTDQAETRRALNLEDKRNLKIGTVFDKILMRDTATGAPVTLVVTSGALVIS